ncbi:hypothetical protein OIO90_000160 [Microbotryomycetes sp. JL221]|nr:hypothetical protein OIO90_000160 [Microbotryomycetes sp. JL221]
MATPKALKVLVTGPALALKSYFAKIATMQAKHSFDYVFAMDLFSYIDNESTELTELLAGQITCPVQAYVSVGGGVLPPRVRAKVEAGQEIAPNVSMLAKTGMLTLASGLRVATLGGYYDPGMFEMSQQDIGMFADSLSVPHFTQNDLDTFKSLLAPQTAANGITRAPPTPDILLTHSLPASLPLLSQKQLGPKALAGAAAELDPVVKLARARYHFVGGAGEFWEREPFEWSRAEGGGNCRALCLGEMGNKKKERWFYAFSITPGAPSGPSPANSTPSPFNAAMAAAGEAGPRGLKRALDTTDDVNEYGVPNYIFGGQQNGSHGGGERRKGRNPPPDHYTCNICNQKGHWIQDCPEKAERDAQRLANRSAPKQPIQPDECWFCLSNPKVTKHLIASIGGETYLTLPKGQLCPTSSSGPTAESPVPGGGHVLIIPIAHYPTMLAIPDDAAGDIISEVDKYKSALKSMYAEYGCSLVAFEVGRLSGKGGHAHVQVLPVPNGLADQTEQVFRSEGTKQGIEFEIVDSLDVLRQDGVTDNYFRVDLPDGRLLVHKIQPKTPFSLQFGRNTAATLLGMPDRADWKACTLSEAQEKNDCSKFKAAFKPFDPSE